MLRALLKILAYGLACSLFAIPYWVQTQFGTVSVEQVLYHLSFGAEGLFTSDPALIFSFIRIGIVLPWGLGLLLFAGERFVNHAHAHGVRATLLRLRAGLARLWLRSQRGGGRLLVGLHRIYAARLPLLLLLGGLVYFLHAFSVLAYLRSFYGEDLFSGEYINPRDVRLKREQPRSLVLIYVESLENTYSDPKLFGKDLLARLSGLKKQYLSFDNYTQMPGAHWTIAGIVASQCGIPLKSLAMFDGNDQGEKVGQFLPNARCLGDILDAQGYSNTFMNGASLDFAGVGKFFRDHHYKRLYGREEWIGLGEKQETMSGWGLHDDDLFHQARSELAKLIKQNRPFNLTLLTIDTHHPYGHLSTHCAQKGYTDFEGIVECTGGQVADFVEYISRNGWLDKVDIVIQGDHLAMGNTAYDKLIQSPKRTVFNLLISNRKRVKNTEDVTHFDMFPTILDLIGLKVEGERLGLGYSALGVPQVPRPAERQAQLQQVLQNYSAAYRKLWQEP
jgi:phosphoglycerol transferase